MFKISRDIPSIVLKYGTQEMRMIVAQTKTVLFADLVIKLAWYKNYFCLI
jgi:hypothetical protein